MPTLVVAICTRNRADSLRGTFDSLVVASRAPLAALDGNWEVLVVDNGSCDHTANVIDDFREQIPLRSVCEPGVGLSRARNAALALSSGEWIVFTDDDALVAPDWLAAIADALERYPQMDFFGGRSLALWETPRPEWASDPGLPFIQGLLCHFDFGEDDREIPQDGMLPFGVNMGMRRAMVERVGTFRTDLGPGTPARGEETEYLERARAAGFRCWYLGSVLVHHRADAARFSIGALYRHGIAKGRGHALVSGVAARPGSVARELWQLLGALWQTCRGKGGWMRVCIVNAGIERGLRRGRSGHGAHGAGA